jgi:riboflavin biosynthesis pyrimidine reductase
MVDVNSALERLASLGWSRVLVEGGPRLIRSFIEAGAWDAFWHYQSNQTFGSDGVEGADTPGDVTDEVRLGGDTRRRYINPATSERLTRALDARVSSAAGRMRGVHGDR